MGPAFRVQRDGLDETDSVRCLRIQVSVVFELACPVEEPTQNLYGRQRRERPPRSPVRVVLVLDVSHSMAEPHGSSVDNTATSQVQYSDTLI